MAKAPEFAQPAVPLPRLRLAVVWPWLVAPLLAFALLMQVAIADRARFAADPLWRPRIEALCLLVRCTIPDWHEPLAFHVTSREVRPHPSAPGALLVTATFRNDAAFAQAWPVLQLSLANVDGESLGLRRFTPAEYLGSAPTGAHVGPGQSATLTLEIMDPGKRAVEFGFEFR